MSKYKRLLERVQKLENAYIAPISRSLRVIEGSKYDERIQDLEDTQREILKTMKELECGDHEWTFSGTQLGFYEFRCTKCSKQIICFEKWLTGTMRPQLELLGYLEPEKKTKKEKS